MRASADRSPRTAAVELLETRQLLAAVTLAQLQVIDTPGIAVSAQAAGNRLFIADSTGGLQIYDVTDPQAPQFAGSVFTGQSCTDVEVRGNLAYLAAGRNLQVVNLSNLQTLGSLALPGLINGLEVVGTTVYVADGGNGLRIVNAANPQALAEVGFVATTNATEVAVAGTRAYVADGLGGVRIVDVTNSSAPRQVLQLNANQNTLDIGLTGSTLLALTRSTGLISCNLNNLSAALATFATPNGQVPVSMDVAGGVVYLGTSAGLYALDASNPAALSVMGSTSFGLNTAEDVRASGGLLVVSTGTTGVRLVEASVPGASVVNGQLLISGTPQGDRISLSVSGGQIIAQVNGGITRVALAGLSSVVISAGDGADQITTGNGMPDLVIYGGRGNDTLSTGSSRDVIYAGGGNDSVRSGGGDDVIYGQAGNDTLNGGRGNDSLDGGNGNDVLIGGAGRDVMIAGTGVDSIFARDGERDRLFINTLEDLLQYDVGLDVLRVG